MTPAPDRLWALGLRRGAQIRRGEHTVQAAALAALRALGDVARAQLAASGMNPAVLDMRNPAWQAAVTDHLLPAVRTVYAAGWAQEDRTAAVTAAAQPAERGPVTRAVADLAADAYLRAAQNRLVGVSETVYQMITAAIIEGRSARTVFTDAQGVEHIGVGESIPQLAARIDALLADEERWRNRATVIARTETIGANNAGAHDAAANNATVLGYSEGQVQKEWLATSDARTRPTHQDANGQLVLGLHSAFTVGGAAMQRPGDPAGPADEVIQCRCTTLYHYPGDPDYTGPAAVAASASLYPHDPDPSHTVPVTREETAMTVTAAVPPPDDPTDEPGPDEQDDQAEAQNGVIVCALPAETDPAQAVTPDDGLGDALHATLLYFGDVPADGAENPNTLLTDDFRTLLTTVVAQVAEAGEPFTETVTGVESLGDEGARVWMLAGDTLPGVRADLIDTDMELQGPLDGVEQYPEFTPHVTIGYPEPGEPAETPTALDPETEAAAAEVTSISFDRLAVWWAGERVEFPLGGDANSDGNTEPPAEATLSVGTVNLLEAGRIDLGTLALDRGVVYLGEQKIGTYADAPDALPTPAPEPAAGPAKAQDIPADGEPFYGIIWPEDVASGDSRGVEAGGTTWRDLPLPLMYQDATLPGHDGAVRAGRIDTLERDSETYSVPVIRYAGVWDTSAVAVEAARQVENRIVRGISVDGDRVTVELRGSDGKALDPMVDDFPEDGVVVEVATEARVSGGTICSVPAFHQAYLANGTLAERTDPEPGWNDDGTPKDNTLSEPAAVEVGEEPTGDAPEPVAASAAALIPDLVRSGQGSVPQMARALHRAAGRDMAPAWTLVASAAGQTWDLPVWPYADFSNPHLDERPEPQRLTIDAEGRVYGYLAVWGICHIGVDGICQEPPDSASNYAYFGTGKVETTEGIVAVGQLTMGTGHADLYASHRHAVEHYDNTGAAVADVAMGQDGVGIWFAGRLRPGATPEQVYAMRASGSVSGDWRPIGTGLELVAALVVNVPGFPIPNTAVAASAAGPLALVAAGVVRPQPAEETPAPTYDEAVIVARVVDHLDRRARLHAAAARLRTARRTAAAARLNRMIRS